MGRAMTGLELAMLGESAAIALGVLVARHRSRTANAEGQDEATRKGEAHVHAWGSCRAGMPRDGMAEK